MPRSAARPDKTLGVVLRRAREKRGLSQEAVAFRAGITTGTLARLELGQSDPAWSTVLAVTGALGLSLRELVASIDTERKRG